MTALFRPHVRAEQSFYRSLLSVMDFLERAGYSGAAPLDLTARLRTLVTAPFWVRYAEEAARSMVTMLFVDGARDWREAARMSGRGRDIYDALRTELLGPVGSAFYAEVGRNAELIRTLPLSVANRVTSYIADETAKGRRPDAIAEEIAAMFPRAARASAQLIARTEVAKTQGTLTRARAENAGIPAYVWRTSEDQRVRDSHRHMDGVIVLWDEPPSPERLIGKKNPPAPYHAGGIFNCRCVSLPLVRPDDVDWPHPCYHAGAVRMTRRAEFEGLLAPGSRLAA